MKTSEALLSARAYPHLHSPTITSDLYWRLSAAISIVIAVGIWRSGPSVALVVLVAVVTAVVVDGLVFFAAGRAGLGDGSALYTALLLAALFPVGVPLSFVALGVVLARLLGCWIMGGPGPGWFSPPVLGYWLVVFSTSGVTNGSGRAPLNPVISDLSGRLASGLGELLDPFLGLPLPPDAIERLFGGFDPSVGAIPIAVMTVSIYLIGENLAPVRISGAFLASFAGVAALLSGYSSMYDTVVDGGALLVGVFVMADPSVWPKRTSGMVIFGLLSGSLAATLSAVDGAWSPAMASVLLVQPIVPLLDGWLAEGTIRRMRLS